MRYRIVDIELSQPLQDFVLDADQVGVGLICRWHRRLIGFALIPVSGGPLVTALEVRQWVESRFKLALLRAKAASYLAGKASTLSRSPVSISIAICTKDRANRLKRLLQSLVPVIEDSGFAAVEVVVVDNASVDLQTRDVVRDFPGFRYVREERTGLDFARNAALHAASGDLVAYLDDDVVVDHGWLRGLYGVWADRPEAGGFTGLVLPFRLDSQAQIEFEQLGGFGRGFDRIHHRETKFADPLFPVTSGNVGAGCNMTFDRRLVIGLGGFDEALDTGAALPGGGDLDMFYRVLRTGRGMVYDPQYAVFHEHRETLQQLRRQYWSWGLGFMAFVVKCRQADPALHAMHSATVRWWFRYQIVRFLRSVLRRSGQSPSFALAELRGAVQGLTGEYQRSQSRSRKIRESVEGRGKS